MLTCTLVNLYSVDHSKRSVCLTTRFCELIISQYFLKMKRGIYWGVFYERWNELLAVVVCSVLLLLVRCSLLILFLVVIYHCVTNHSET